MPTYQDTFLLSTQDNFDSATGLASLEGAEVEGGLLLPSNLDEGVCLNFNGSSQYVNLGSSNIFTPSGTVMTTAAWIKTTKVNGQRVTQFLRAAGSTAFGLSIALNTAGADTANGVPRLFYRDGANALQTIIGGAAVNDDKWHHLVGVLDGSNVYFYVDGALNSSATNANSTNTKAFSVDNTSIGLGISVGTYFSGQMDGVQFFHVALTAEQVQKLYATGVNPSTPFGDWKFNDGSGTTATDSGSGGNNGDLTGHAPTWTTSHNPFYARRARATSVDRLNDLGATAVNSWAYTIDKKPGGTEIRAGFASDGSTFKNSNGDLVGNTGGYSFDGVNDSAILDVADFRSSDSSGSISAWVYLDATGKLHSIFGSCDFASAVRYFVFYVDTVNKLSVQQRNNDTVCTTIANTALQLNRWHFVTLTSSGTAWSMYINGVAEPLTVSFGTNNGDWFADTSLRDNISIGCVKFNGTTTNFVQGSIDDVRVFTQTLSADEVWDLYSRQIQPYTPVGWWKLDGDGTDSSSSGNDLTINGATALTEFSSLAPAGEALGDVNTLSFDGVNDRVTAGSIGAFDAYTSGTISGWICIRTIGVNHGIIGYDDGTATNRFYIAVLSGNQFAVYMMKTAVQTFYISASPVTLVAGAWYHFAFVADGTGNKLYINGVQVTPTYTTGSSSTQVLFGNLTGLSCQFATGRSMGGGGSYFYHGGLESNIAIHSTALSATQIYTDFLNGYPSSSNLAAHWPLNDGSGTNADDPVGGFDGAISGATWIKSTTRPEPAAVQRTLTPTYLTSSGYSRINYRSLDHDRVAALTETTWTYTSYLLEGAEVENSLLLPSNLDDGVCLDFSGSSQYVDLGDSGDFTFGNGSTDSPFSMMMWVCMDDATNFFLFNKDDFGGAGTQREYRWFVNGSDKISMVLIDNSAGFYIGRNYNTALTSYQGQWIHVAVTYDGSSSSSGIKIYVNGSRVDDTNENSGAYVAMENKSTALQIGARVASSTYANGKIDDARLFNSELTSEEIQKIYSTGENPSTPLGWWKFNDGLGETVIDYGSGGNNGDLTGHAPTWTTSHNPFYSRRARATSVDQLDGLGATAVDNWSYTTSKKPGGTEIRVCFASDGSTFKNSNGDLVGNAGGYSFDGTDDVITVNKTVAQLMSASTGTISCWMKIKGPGSSVASAATLPVWQLDGIVSESAGYAGIQFGTITGSLETVYFYNFDITSTYIPYRVSTNLYNQWMHLVWVHSSGVLYGYVNGDLVGSVSSGNTGNTTGTIRIGCNWLGSGGSDFFNGDVDDVRIYNVGFSADDVWDLFSRHKDNYTSSSQRKLWLKLDGDATDSSGNGNDGVVSGATALSEFSSLPTFGELLSDNSNVLDFDGINDFIAVADASALRPANALTLSTWINLTPSSSGFTQGIIGKYLASGNWVSYRIQLSSTNQIVFAVHSKTLNKFPTWTSSAVPIGSRQWCHIAVTYTRTNFDSTDAVIYFNGVPVSASYAANGYNGSFTIEYSAGQLGIGRLEVDTPANYMWGKLANTSLHDAALSATQVYTDFLNGYPSTSNLVAYWPLSDGSGTNADDPIGGYDGSISGATWTKDSFRPEAATTPTQQTIDLSSLGLTSAAYNRFNFRSNSHNLAAALAETTWDYTVGEEGEVYEDEASGGAVAEGAAESLVDFYDEASGGAVAEGTAEIGKESSDIATGGAVVGTSAENILIPNPFRTRSRRFEIGQWVRVLSTGESFRITDFSDNGSIVTYYGKLGRFAEARLVENSEYAGLEIVQSHQRIEALMDDIERLGNITPFADPQQANLTTIAKRGMYVYYLRNGSLIKNEIVSVTIDTSGNSYRMRNGDIVAESAVMNLNQVREFALEKLEAIQI